MSPIKLTKLAPRERAGLGVAGVFILLMLAKLVVLQPAMLKIKNIDRDIAFTENELRFCKTIVASNYVAEVERIYNNVKQHMPDVQSPSTILNEMQDEIDTLANRNGISIQNMKSGETRVSEYYHEFVVRAEVVGTMQQLITFCHQLHRSPRSTQLLRIRELSVAPKKKAGQVTGAMLITRIAIPMDAEPEEKQE